MKKTWIHLLAAAALLTPQLHAQRRLGAEELPEGVTGQVVEIAAAPCRAPRLEAGHRPSQLLVVMAEVDDAGGRWRSRGMVRSVGSHASDFDSPSRARY